MPCNYREIDEKIEGALTPVFIALTVGIALFLAPVFFAVQTVVAFVAWLVACLLAALGAVICALAGIDPPDEQEPPKEKESKEKDECATLTE